MWLIVGLGNPGGKYERNRHNIGFMVVDELARKHNLPAWTDKLGGQTTAGPIVSSERGPATAPPLRGNESNRDRERVVLVKPMEYMNLSGFCVQRMAQFHKVPPERILVVHDEIDLPFGVVRLKNAGGHGGHNGLRSIVDQLGKPSFARLRMGVGRDPNARPGADVAGWVLSDFPSAHATVVTAMIAAGCEDAETVLAKGIGPAMNQHNNRPSLAPT